MLKNLPDHRSEVNLQRRLQGQLHVEGGVCVCVLQNQTLGRLHITHGCLNDIN